MAMQTTSRSTYFRSALLSGFAACICLAGGFIVPFALALAMSALFGAAEPPQPFVIGTFMFALVSLIGGGAAWGVALARYCAHQCASAGASTALHGLHKEIVDGRAV
jgi:hypothetical protein